MSEPTYESLQRRWMNDPHFHARVSTAVGMLDVEYRKSHGGRSMDEEARAFARLAAGFAIEVMEGVQSAYERTPRPKPWDGHACPAMLPAPAARRCPWCGTRPTIDVSNRTLEDDVLDGLHDEPHP